MAREDIYAFTIVVFITITVVMTYVLYKVVSKFALRWFAEKDQYEEQQKVRNEAYYKELHENNLRITEAFESSMKKMFSYLEREQVRNDTLYSELRADRHETNTAIKLVSDRVSVLNGKVTLQGEKIDKLGLMVDKYNDKVDDVIRR